MNVPPLPEKRKFSPLVKSREKERKVVGIRADEQFITQAEASKVLGAKLGQVNEELEDLVGLRKSGADSAASKKREEELILEAKKLIGYVNDVEKGISREQREEALEGVHEILVPNPFYQEKETELSEKDLEEIPELDEADVEMEGEKEAAAMKEMPRDAKGLRVRYAELKKQNEKFNLDIKNAEAGEKMVLGLISQIQGAGPALREAQIKKGLVALSSLLGDDRKLVADVESASRSTITYLGLNHILETIDDRITKLAQEKGRVLVDMSDVGERLKEIGSGEVEKSLRAGKAAQANADIERSLKAGQDKEEEPPKSAKRKKAA
jgi:hypothetical protein